MTVGDALAPVHAAASNVYELGVFGKVPSERFGVFGVQRHRKRMKNVAGLVTSDNRDRLFRAHSHDFTSSLSDHSAALSQPAGQLLWRAD